MCKKFKINVNKMSSERRKKIEKIKKLASEIKKSGIMEWYFND